jgi:anthranilate phosphoribosyltransferase
MTDTDVLNRLVSGQDLSYNEMLALMRRIMQGQVAQTVMAAMLVGLRIKRETVDELAAGAQVMRELVQPVLVPDKTHLVDLCGTGGDGAMTFNISTAAMFVASAAGARVAKHGGRSVSSHSGSADVLEVLGGCITLTCAQVASCLQATGVGFMFAPNHHAAMKHAAPVRKELGLRTVFNLLGPLTNPAAAPNQLMGVFAPELVGLQARVLQRLGAHHAMVVHGLDDGLDELSLCGPTQVAELVHGVVNEYIVHPSDFGLATCKIGDLTALDKQASAQCLLRALGHEPGPVRDVVLLNAGAALYCANVVSSMRDGVTLARETVLSGLAQNKLTQWVQTTQQLGAAT